MDRNKKARIMEMMTINSDINGYREQINVSKIDGFKYNQADNVKFVYNQIQMGCTDSTSTEVLQNKSQFKPPSHSQLLSQSSKNPMDIFMLGQVAANKYLYKGLSWQPGKGVKIFDKQLPPVYTFKDATHEDKPKGKRIKWVLQETAKTDVKGNKKGKQSSSNIFQPMNFSQITPIQTNKNIPNKKYQHFLISGGISFSLDNITQQSYLLTITATPVNAEKQKNLTYQSYIHRLPDMNQARYTHTSLFHEGYVYVTGGRYFGDDTQAILRSCERFGVMSWISSIEKHIDILVKGKNEQKKEKQEDVQKQKEQTFQIEHNFWEILPLMNVPRCTHTSVLQDGCIYALGGYTGDCERSTVIQILNLKKNKKEWVQVEAELPYGIESAKFIHNSQEKQIIIMGGNTNHGPSNTVLIINLHRMTIRAGNKLNFCRMLHKSIVVNTMDNRQKLLIIGGHAAPLNAQNDFKPELDLEIYDFMKNYSSEQCVSEEQGNQQQNKNQPEHSAPKDLNNKANRDLLKKHFISQDIFEALSHSQFIFYDNKQENMMMQENNNDHQKDIKNDEVFYIFGTSQEPFIIQCNISAPYIKLHGLPLKIRTFALQGGAYLNVKNNSDNQVGGCLLFGGISDCQEEVSDRTYLYLPHYKQNEDYSELCLELGKMNVRRYAFTTQNIFNKEEDYYQIYALGGGSIAQQEQQGEDNLLILNKCEKIRIPRKGKPEDIRKSKWEQIGDLPKALISPMSLCYKKQVYVFGGMMKNKERYQDIIRYNSNQNKWNKIQYQFPFGIQAASIYQIKKPEEGNDGEGNEYLIFGGRVVNGDTNGIWQLTMLDKELEGQNSKDYGYSCVFQEKSKMTEAKCLHKVYKPKHQNFYVVFGGGKQLISCYDCQSLKTITESDILTGLKMLFVDNLKNLQDPTLKKYTIMSTL